VYVMSSGEASFYEKKHRTTFLMSVRHVASMFGPRSDNRGVKVGRVCVFQTFLRSRAGRQEEEERETAARGLPR